MEPKYETKNMKSYELQDYVPIIEKDEFDYIYRPNDDTFLLLDALKLDFEANPPKDANIICEIGSGSGMVINNYSNWIKKINNNCLIIATDINYDACYLTKKFSDFYMNEIFVVNTNILNSLNLKKKIDIIICNPPYVPTSKKELFNSINQIQLKNNEMKNNSNYLRNINCIDVSYAGGKNGMEITDKIIKSSIEFLAENGVFYLLLIEENKPEKVVKFMKESGFKNELLAKRKFQNEIQYIFKFFKSNKI